MTGERRITYREAVREAIAQEMESDPRVFVMGEDVGVYGGSYGVLKGLIDRFSSERIRDTPISEAGFTGAAVGAAMTGTRPIVEIMYSDFLTTAMDQVVNQAAKMHSMFSGALQVPMVIRSPVGSGTGAAAQHSQSVEAWFAHVPGLKVVMPSTPYDAKGLLISAVRDHNPVLVFEPKTLYSAVGEVPEAPYTVPFGCAVTRRSGRDIAVITYGRTAPLALKAAQELEAESGISCTVVDLRSLVPMDEQAVLDAAAAAGRVIILHEAVQTAGFGAEIASRIAEHPGTLSRLKAPLVRVCGKDVPIPFAPELEAAAVPQIRDIKQAALRLMREYPEAGLRKKTSAG